MRVLSTLADKLVGTLARKSTAQAATCEYRRCGPSGTGRRLCCLSGGVWTCSPGCQLP